jgi:hypothetical protein
VVPASSDGGNAGAVIGVLAAIGGTYFLLDDDADEGQLAAAQPLSSEGEASQDSSLVSLAIAGGTASVAVATATGTQHRGLALQYSAEGLRHYGSDENGVHVELSFDTRTREFFYRESGLSAGQPYTLSTHGWLKAQVAAR